MFLNNTWPCDAVATFLKKTTANRILEIGPGAGILTKVLIDNGFHVTAIEKDERYALALKEQIKNPNLTVIHQDILDFDLKKWLQASSQETALCGNIPYHISTPIISQFLPHLSDLKAVMLLVQLEFAQRLTAKTNTKHYGSLSVYVQLRSELTLEHVVEKRYFTPVPKIDSALVSFKNKTTKEPEKKKKKVERLSKLSFSLRRKKLKNSLKPLLTDKIQKHLTIDLNRRCETLSPSDLVELANELFPQA